MIPVAFSRLHWMELDTAAEEPQKIEKVNTLGTIKTVMRTAFFEGKTFNLTYVLPAHSVIVQALLNLNTSSVKKLYSLTSQFDMLEDLKVKDVVTSEQILNPLLINMRLSEFRKTVELLYFCKEYFISLYGTALVNVTCADKCDVLLVLSQNMLSCNLCSMGAHQTRLFQCVECNVSTVCYNCMQTEKGSEYLEAHAHSCQKIQDLLRPIVQKMTFAHLCFKCFTPLHKHVHKNHFNPEIQVLKNKKKISVTHKKACCSIKNCKRNLCLACLTCK